MPVLLAEREKQYEYIPIPRFLFRLPRPRTREKTFCDLETKAKNILLKQNRTHTKKTFILFIKRT